MSNNIGWGQAVLNNAIGWGQGFINSIGWGVSYEYSHSSETWIGYTQTAISFRDRVLLDGGTIESLKCIKL